MSNHSELRTFLDNTLTKISKKDQSVSKHYVKSNKVFIYVGEDEEIWCECTIPNERSMCIDIHSRSEYTELHTVFLKRKDNENNYVMFSNDEELNFTQQTHPHYVSAIDSILNTFLYGQQEQIQYTNSLKPT